MTTDLLTFPPEIFQLVLDEALPAIGLFAALKLRTICKAQLDFRFKLRNRISEQHELLGEITGAYTERLRRSEKRLTSNRLIANHITSSKMNLKYSREAPPCVAIREAVEYIEEQQTEILRRKTLGAEDVQSIFEEVAYNFSSKLEYLQTKTLQRMLWKKLACILPYTSTKSASNQSYLKLGGKIAIDGPYFISNSVFHVIQPYWPWPSLFGGLALRHLQVQSAVEEQAC